MDHFWLENSNNCIFFPLKIVNFGTKIQMDFLPEFSSAWILNQKLDFNTLWRTEASKFLEEQKRLDLSLGTLDGYRRCHRGCKTILKADRFRLDKCTLRDLYPAQLQVHIFVVQCNSSRFHISIQLLRSLTV